MGVYQIDTDAGTYEITTEEPADVHTQLPQEGQSLDLSGAVKNAAATASGLVTPPAQPQGSFLSRLKGAAQDLFTPNMDSIKRLFNPNAGQFGPSRVLEQAGQQVGNAVKSSGQNIGETLATSRFGQQNTNTAAAIGAGIGTVADVTANSLTPSAFQQQLGAEGATSLAPEAAKALARPIDTEAGDAARRALGFQKSQLSSTKSPFESMRKMAQANQAARSMLDKGDIPWLGSTDTMQASAVKSLSEGAKAVSSVLDQVDATSPKLEEVQIDSALTKALDPKNQAELNAALAVRQDLSDRLVQGQLPIKELDNLRSEWGKLGFQDKTVGSPAADIYRKAWKSAGDMIKGHIEESSPQLLDQYKAGMADQSTSLTALKGIMNKSSKLEGNNVIGLPTMILAAGRVGSGDFLGAAEVVGAMEALKRSGAAFSANALKGTAELLNSQATAAPGIASGLQGAIHNYLSQNSPKGSEAPNRFMDIIKQASQNAGDTMISPGGPQPTAEAALMTQSTNQPMAPDQVANRNAIQALLSGNTSEAKKFWQQAVKINPDNNEAIVGLQRIAMKEGKGIYAYKGKR